ncbi:MAG: M48 family metallopeptidase [Alphaproteobacteria bacterium]|nr:M48 family metallopeptidase [Alphaproteobacteria bacterium]
MTTIKNRIILCFMAMTAVFLCFIAIGTPFAHAQGGKGMTIIRDTEIENTLREWSTPIFKAAGLNPEAINIILVQSDQMNAFVAGGSNIFIYTGLINKTDNPGELIGVIAHETGHIAGGHLIRSRDAMERASYESIVGMLVGVGAALASGEAGAVPAIAIGGGSMAQRRLLAHSRVQESSADQAALTFLEQAKINPTGMLTFMEKLKAEIYMPSNQQSEYIQTHPLVENRIEALETRDEASPYKNQPYPASWVEAHARMKAKLAAFINPGSIPWIYSDRDMSIPARYARAIAAYRNNQVDSALSQIDDLLKAEPQNPYFLELKGQMLVDFGRGSAGLPFYRKAIDLLPKAPLLRIALGHALIESAPASSSPDASLREAIDQLERAAQDEPNSTQLHRFLAIAYGKLGDENMAKVHLAEEALLQRRFDYAKEQAEGVLKHAEKNSKAWLRAKDVLSFVENNEKG